MLMKKSKGRQALSFLPTTLLASLRRAAHPGGAGE